MMCHRYYLETNYFEIENVVEEHMVKFLSFLKEYVNLV